MATQKALDEGNDQFMNIKAELRAQVIAQDNAATQNEKLIAQENAAPTLRFNSGDASDLQTTLNSVLQGLNVDPKLEQTMSVLAQLEYLNNHSSQNFTGQVLLVDHPDLVQAMQQLGLQIPNQNNSPIAGLAAKMAIAGTPPYDTPENAQLAQSLPAGWESISSANINNLIFQLAGMMKQEAGNSFGVLQKPMEELFGNQLFLPPPAPPPGLQNDVNWLQDMETLKGLLQGVDGNAIEAALENGGIDGIFGPEE